MNEVSTAVADDRISDGARSGEVARMDRQPLLHLQRGMGDPEAVAQESGRRGEERVLSAVAGPDEMRGERDVGRAHPPDVEVVHLDYPLQSAECRVDLERVDAGRHRVEGE